MRVGAAACLAFLASGSAWGQTLPLATASANEQTKPEALRPTTLKPMPLMPDGQPIAAGDLLRTTRVFPNWNLNCDVVVSQGRHICAVETRSLDSKGRDLLAWSIALSTQNTPIMVFKVPGDIDVAHGLQMTAGAFTTTFQPAAGDCAADECRLVVPFDATLRGIVATQNKVSFSLKREGVVFAIVSPLPGLGEALEMARRDPIGLVALQHKLASPAEPRVAARSRAASAQASVTSSKPATVAR